MLKDCDIHMIMLSPFFFSFLFFFYNLARTYSALSGVPLVLSNKCKPPKLVKS